MFPCGPITRDLLLPSIRIGIGPRSAIRIAASRVFRSHRAVFYVTALFSIPRYTGVVRFESHGKEDHSTGLRTKLGSSSRGTKLAPLTRHGTSATLITRRDAKPKHYQRGTAWSPFLIPRKNSGMERSTPPALSEPHNKLSSRGSSPVCGRTNPVPLGASVACASKKSHGLR